MQRREFLKIGSLGGAAAAAVTGCGGHGTAVLTDLVTDPESIPHEEGWVRGLCRICAAGCGIRTRVVEGRAVKIEGDPEHPSSRGGLCARGQAGLQALYHPDRHAGPMRREGPRAAGRWKQLSWDEALAGARDELAALPASSVMLLTGRLRGHRLLAARRFAETLGAPQPLIVEALHDEPMRAAHFEMMGQRALGTPDIAGCAMLLSVGLSFVESGPSPVAHQQGLAAMRSSGRSPGRFVQVEPRYSLTAAAADAWIPARPGTELALLLAVIAHIVREGLFDEPAVRRSSVGFDPAAWIAIDSARAAEICDVPAAAIESLARSLASARPALVLFGGIAAGQSNALAAARAVCVLNCLLGAYGPHPGGIRIEPPPVAPLEVAGGALADRLSSSSIGCVICLDTDPAYLAPATRRALSDAKTVPLVITCAAIPDDTSTMADWILPDLTSYERLESDLPDGASASIACEPAVRPFTSALSIVETLAALSPAGTPWGSERDLIAEFARRAARRQEHGGSDPVRFPRQGIAWAAPRHEAYFAEQPLILLPCASLALADGSTASLPWMQELLDPMSQQRWDSWIEINPRDALTLGVTHGQHVAVSSEYGRIVTRAVLTEAVMPGTAVSLVGQGHAGGGRYAAGRGESILTLLAPVTSESGHPAWGATRVAIDPASPGGPRAEVS